MKRYVVPLCTNKLPLGRMGENKATEIVFNISEWRAAYGDGTVVLLHKRHKDIAPYPATTTVDGDTVTWLVTNVDTAQMGCGSAEMQYVIGDIVVKSVVWITSVLPSLGDPVDVPDTPPQKLDGPTERDRCRKSNSSGYGKGRPNNPGQVGGQEWSSY